MTCHLPHGSMQPKLAAKPLVDICSECHDVKEKAFSSAHLGIDPKNIQCVSCHDPHASKDPKFFKKAVHPPFAARECDTCHQAPKK
jgi:predicted CXXCH cytochrome family protein